MNRKKDNYEIGKRVKDLRLMRGLTQQELELAMGASFGSISRIENGETNPTKETLRSIANELELSPNSTLLLFGVSVKSPEKNEIAKVVESLKEEIDKNIEPGYILDFRWNIHYWNKQILRLFNLDEAELTKADSINLLSLYFDQKFNLKKELGQKTFFSLGEELIHQFRYESQSFVNEVWYSNLLGSLSELDDYMAINDSIENKQSTLLARNKFKFRSLGGVLHLECNTSIYYPDPRFSLVKYFPQNFVTRKVLEILYKVK